MAWGEPKGFADKFKYLRATPVYDKLPDLPESGTAGFYLVAGADSWLRQRTLDHCVRHHLGGEDGEGASFRLRRLDGAADSGDEIQTAVRAVSFTGGPVVVVRDALRLAQPLRREAELLPFFRKLVESPPKRAALIFEWEKDPDRQWARFPKDAEEDDPRRPLRAEWEALEKALAAGVEAGRIRVFDCDPPSERALPGWIRREAKALRLALPQEGAEFLARRFGQDLRRQRGELEKLQIYCDDAKPTRDDLEKAVGGGFAEHIFEFTNAVEAGQPEKALGRLQLLLREGTVAQQILPLLHNLAVRCQIAQIAGCSDSELANRLRVPHGVASRVNARARQYDKMGWIEVVSRIAEMDFLMKSAQAPAEAILAGLTIRLSGRGGR